MKIHEDWCETKQTFSSSDPNYEPHCTCVSTLKRFDEFARDFSQAIPRPKSEIRERLKELQSSLLDHVIELAEKTKVKTGYCNELFFGYHNEDCEGCDWNNALSSLTSQLQELKKNL